MGNKEAEYWKLFYDAIRALFVLDDMLDKQYNWYYQELFYIKLFSFLDESLNYITNCEKEFEDSRLMLEWLQHVRKWRLDLFNILSEDEIVYIQYRRTRAAHMFQHGFEYDADVPTQNDIRIVCKEGGRKNYSRVKVDICRRNVENGYKSSNDLDKDFDKKIHSVLRSMRLDLNNVYESYSVNTKVR